MKTDRLLGITMYLLNREIVSATELAEKFEVSVRTIARDAEALSLAGIPVASSAGAGGGYRIMDSFRLGRPVSTAEDYRHGRSGRHRQGVHAAARGYPLPAKTAVGAG